MNLLMFNSNRVKYTWLQVTPDYGDRNVNSQNFIKSMISILEEAKDRIDFNFRKREINIFQQKKIMFMSNYTHDLVTFNICIPEDMNKYFKVKIYELWPKAVIEEVNISMSKPYKAIYETHLKYEDALALSVNKKDNEPLNSLLAASELLENDDELDIVVNIIPITQSYWRKKYDATMAKIRDKQNIEKLEITRNKMYLKLNKAFVKVNSFMTATYMTFFNTLFTESDKKIKADNKKQEDNMYRTIYEAMNRSELKDLSSDTKEKRTDVVFKVQILFCSNSKNDKKAMTIANAFSNSLRIIEGDNQFVFKRLSVNQVDLRNTFITYKSSRKTDSVSSIHLGSRELINFIQLPGSTLIKSYSSIKRSDRIPSTIPPDLQNGDIYMGSVRAKNKFFATFLTKHPEYSAMLMMIIAPPRCGKTTLFQNLARSYILSNWSVLYLDFIQQCNVSEEVASVIPEDKILKINCGDFANLQALAFNELDFKDTDTPEQKYISIKEQTSMMLELISSANENDETRARMKKYFKSACMIAYSYHGSFRDVVNILQNHVIRQKRVSICKLYENKDMYEYLEQSIINLGELDEYDKAGNKVVGTKSHLISGIINRIDSLADNAYMERMLYKSAQDNLNLIDEVQKGKFIAIQIPESKFLNDELKDLLCLFWINKILMVVKKREELIETNKRVKVALMVDELYQLKTVQGRLESQILQLPKFRLKPILSVHHMDQVPTIKKEALASNADTIIISGSKEENVKAVMNRFDPYEIQDILELPEYHALALLKDNKGRSHPFKIKLPGKINR